MYIILTVLFIIFHMFVVLLGCVTDIYGQIESIKTGNLNKVCLQEVVISFILLSILPLINILMVYIVAKYTFGIRGPFDIANDALTSFVLSKTKETN